MVENIETTLCACKILLKYKTVHSFEHQMDVMRALKQRYMLTSLNNRIKNLIYLPFQDINKKKESKTT